MKTITAALFVFSLIGCSEMSENNDNRITKAEAKTVKKIIESANAPAPIGPYSQAVMHGNTLYVSGQIAIDPATGILDTSSIANETEWVMKNLGAVLNEAGMDYSNVLKCSIFLSDMGSFTEVNDVYAKYFENQPPARETAAVQTLPKNVNVEISCIAAK
jgi:2-iminobutanoate/2-iminopropanoate deaminase